MVYGDVFAHFSALDLLSALVGLVCVRACVFVCVSVVCVSSCGVHCFSVSLSFAGMRHKHRASAKLMRHIKDSAAPARIRAYPIKTSMYNV